MRSLFVLLVERYTRSARCETKYWLGLDGQSCDCVSCDLKEPFQVEALVSSCRVVCNIAGPFMLTGGERLVEACIHYDTDYCDVWGDSLGAKLLEFHDVARDAGVYIVRRPRCISASPCCRVTSIMDSCPSHFHESGFFF